MIPMIIGCCAQRNSIGDLNSTIVRVVSDGSQQLTVENQFSTVEFSVDWGDGNVESGGNSLVHTYLTPGEYIATVKLESSSGARNYGVCGDALVEVLQFDHSVTQTYFQLSPNLIKVPDRIPSSFISLNNMFFSCFSFNDASIKNWNVSNITSMNGTLGNAMAFNQDLSGWNVSNVTRMNGMFEGARNFVGDISNWDVSNVTRMNYMFSSAESFNGDISNWDVSNVTNMDSMFRNAIAFNGNISGWDVSNVTNMNTMFSDATSFNQDLSGWCVSNFSSPPVEFDFNAVAWTLPRPVWGTCPNG